MIQISAGLFKGQKLKTPLNSNTRPTQGRLRESIFDTLQNQVNGARVLDLFAGSGGLGFEALSRGAAHCTFVDSSKLACSCIQENIRKLGVKESCRLLKCDVERCESRVLAGAPYDFIFADPPYDNLKTLEMIAELNWKGVVTGGACLVLEWSFGPKKKNRPPEPFGQWERKREKEYGATTLTHYTWKA